MKRLALILGAAAVAAISAPASARAQNGCSWWDLTCNGYANAITGYGWHMTGRDPAGNVVYFRRLVDSNGNVVFEQARRDNYGRYVVYNNHTVRKGTVYGPNGEICKYNSNDKGYKEDCKYAHPLNPKAVKYEAPKVKPVHYNAPKVQHVVYKTHVAPPHKVDYDVKGAKPTKGPEGKDELKATKGPKH